ncbi:MAG: DUF2207 domain-containing protein, partial [Candidatus Moranbacteria bacterium]|nr:DUF2207 domain-containing protein [Candidatus Moranbacteria bacterium]
EEKILYDFGSEQSHGVFRLIPVQYSSARGNYSLRISDVRVTNERGKDRPFSLSRSGDNIRIKVGRSDVLVSGSQTYVFSYSVRRAVNYFDTSDEFYWNVTGNGWPVSIRQSSLVVRFPNSLPTLSVKQACFVGVLGSTVPCDSFSSETDFGNVSSVSFFHGPLDPGEGLTAVVGFPKDVVTPPSFMRFVLDFLWDNLVLFVPVLVFFVMFSLWYRLGRDPGHERSIVAQFDAPDGLSPSEVGTLIDERAQTRDVSAIIIDLAVRGYVSIIQKKKGKFFTSDDYSLEKLRDSDDSLRPFERELFDALFPSGTTVVQLSDLKSSFPQKVSLVVTHIYDRLVDSGYFQKSPQKIRRYYIFFGIFLGVCGIFGGNFFGFPVVFSFVVSGVIVSVFGLFMPVRTYKGVVAHQHILGLRRYLRVAEKDRLSFHNAPEKSPSHFEQLLPYAMVLGVETQWAETFSGIYTQSPSWYRGVDGSTNSLLLVHYLRDFDRVAVTSFSPKSSVSSGGSGFSGGSSGGGFGGGGGGSW